MLNIACFRNDRFGEFLLNIPAFRLLKNNSSDARLTLIVDPYVEGLAQQIGCADEIICWENRKHKFNEILKFAGQLKKKKFDLSIAFNPSKEFNLVSFLTGIPRRIGYDHKWDFLLTHKLQDKKYLGERHEVEYNLELARLAGAKEGEKDASISVDSGIIEELLQGERLSGSKALVAIHPWTSDPLKQWPKENFAALAQALVQEKGLEVIIVGGRAEYPQSLEFCRNLKVYNMAGKTTLLQLAALLKRCRLLITADSGPMHLAASVGTPVIAIFRNDIAGKTPKRWGPSGGGHVVIEKDNLSAISAQEVLTKAKERLNLL